VKEGHSRTQICVRKGQKEGRGEGGTKWANDTGGREKETDRGRKNESEKEKE